MDHSLIDSVSDFARRALAPAADTVDRSGEFPPDRWKQLGEYGLTGLWIPAESGGLGVDRATALAAVEKVAGACGSTAWALLAHSTVAAGILALGTPAQKQRYLPALATGEKVGGTLAVTETGGGSNPGSIRTYARAEAGGYVLDGSKFFITQAGAGDVYLVLARTDHAPGPQSLSCFLVERDDPGLSFGEREETLGLRGIPVRGIFFDGCRLPADRLLGTVGGGMAVMGAIGGAAILGAAAAALGIAQAALDATGAHLRERTVLDQPLAANPAVQARMARIVLDQEGARAWLARGLDWLEQGAKGPPLPLWMAKVAVTEAAARVVDQCLGLHGAIGVSRALPLQRHYRDVRAFSIHWGNNDVLIDTVGKMSLA